MKLSLSKMILAVMALNELCIAVDGITMDRVKKQIKKMIENKTKGLKKNVKNHEDSITDFGVMTNTIWIDTKLLKQDLGALVEEVVTLKKEGETLKDQIITLNFGLEELTNILKEEGEILKDEIITLQLGVEETTKTLKEEGETLKSRILMEEKMTVMDQTLMLTLQTRITEMEGKIALLTS